MKKCVDRLRPVANATEDVEQDQANLDLVLKYAKSHFHVMQKKHTSFRHLDTIRAHWTDQDDLTTFHGPALAALDKRCGKHFATGIYFLAKAFLPSTDIASWADGERDKLNGFFL